MLRAGRFNCRIVIERPIVGKGRSGGTTTRWEAFTNPLWATRASKSGGELPATAVAGGQVAVKREEFTLYLHPGVTEEMRVVVQPSGECFDITHVNDYNAQRCLILTCETGANDG